MWNWSIKPDLFCAVSFYVYLIIFLNILTEIELNTYSLLLLPPVLLATSRVPHSPPQLYSLFDYISCLYAMNVHLHVH